MIASDLPHPSKLIMLVLATWCDKATGMIPFRQRKSLNEISAATSLARCTVTRALDGLDSAGWIQRVRPTLEEARSGARTGYRLLIPIPLGSHSTMGRPAETSKRPIPPRVSQHLGQQALGSHSTMGRPAETSKRPIPPRVSQHQRRLKDLEVVGTSVKEDTDQTSFDRFWQAYPRKIGKQAAAKVWAKALKTGATADQIVAAAEAYAKTKQGTEGRFIAHPTTWLNQGRWDDELDTEEAPSAVQTQVAWEPY